MQIRYFPVGSNLIERHRKDSSYVPTQSSYLAKQTLDSQGIATIIGTTGSGKTKAALQTASEWIKEDESSRMCLILGKNDLLEGIQWSYMKDICVILDDVFTRWMIESKQIQLSSFCHNLHKGHTASEKKLKIIVTIDKLISERHELLLRQFHFFNNSCQVVLTLEKDEKVRILESHSKHGRIFRESRKGSNRESLLQNRQPEKQTDTDSSLNSPEAQLITERTEDDAMVASQEMNFQQELNMAHTNKFDDQTFDTTALNGDKTIASNPFEKEDPNIDDNLGTKSTVMQTTDQDEQLLPRATIEMLASCYNPVSFPSICFMFCNISECFEQETAFFKHCDLRLGSYMIEKLLDNVRKVCLVYAVLHDGVINTEDINLDFLQDICRAFKVKDVPKIKIIATTLHEMENGFFLKVAETLFKISERAMYEAVIKYLKEQKQELFVRLCSPEVIKEHIRGKHYKPKHGGLVLIAEKGFLKSMTTRIYQLISQDRDLSYHPLMESQKV